MRRINPAVIIVTVFCLILTGCKSKGSSGTEGPKSSLASSSSTAADDTEKDKREDKNEGKNSKTDKKNRVPVSGKVEKEEPEVDYEDVFAPVLDEARDIIKNGYDFDRDYDHISEGLMERVMYPGDDDLSEVIGYYYKDLNDDDIPELLIGENSAGEYDDPDDIAYIYGGYSCKDGKPVCFVEGWARNRQNYLGNGRFFNMGSSGAMNTCFGEWHLSEDGTEQVWDDFYFSMEDAGSRAPVFFRNTTGNEDVNESEKLDITEEEFLNLIDKRAFKCDPIAWTPLGPEETGDDEDRSAQKDGMIFPDSDTRRLTDADIEGLDAQELRFARNEIYARHGRKFKAEDLKNHFESMDWYSPSIEPDDFDEHVLNEYEIYNLKLIGSYEK